VAEQLGLFEATLTPDVIVECALCGSSIVSQHFVMGGVESEYRGRDGECFACQRKRGNRG
jgi:hypothetical protein